MTDEKYEGYMTRLEQEYRDYSVRMWKLPGISVFDRADEIQAVKLAYEYIRSADISHEELEYAMTAMYPLQEIAGHHEAFRPALVQENPVAQTVYDIWDKRLFSDGDTELFNNRVPIRFHRKMANVSEILAFPRNGPDDTFHIKKVIRLGTKDFSAYANALDTEQAFLTDNRGIMYVDRGGDWHCILVQDAANQRGLLICADGYGYARYSAYVENTRELSLENIPTEDYARKQWSRGRKTKQPERWPFLFLSKTVPHMLPIQLPYELAPRQRAADSGRTASRIWASIAPRYLGAACKGYP